MFTLQGTDLRRIFHFIVNLLGEVVKVEGKMSEELSALLLKLLVIAETTLTWSFISLHYILLYYFACMCLYISTYDVKCACMLCVLINDVVVLLWVAAHKCILCWTVIVTFIFLWYTTTISYFSSETSSANKASGIESNRLRSLFIRSISWINLAAILQFLRLFSVDTWVM